MSRASIVEQAPGAFQLLGVLDYLSGPELREQGARLIGACQASVCTVDCEGVKKSSSVGLALLLAFMRDASAAGKTLAVKNLPEDMRGIAGVCELLELLPLES